MLLPPELEAITDRLLRPDVPEGGGLPPAVGAAAPRSESSAAAAERALDTLAHALGRWFGPYGYHAVLTRALATARQEHPALVDVRIGRPEAPSVEGLRQAQATHGPAALHAGTRALVAHVLALLGRVIGSDLLLHLVTPLASGKPPTAAPPPPPDHARALPASPTGVALTEADGSPSGASDPTARPLDATAATAATAPVHPAPMHPAPMHPARGTSPGTAPPGAAPPGAAPPGASPPNTTLASPRPS